MTSRFALVFEHQGKVQDAIDDMLAARDRLDEAVSDAKHAGVEVHEDFIVECEGNDWVLDMIEYRLETMSPTP